MSDQSALPQQYLFTKPATHNKLELLCEGEAKRGEHSIEGIVKVADAEGCGSDLLRLSLSLFSQQESSAHVVKRSPRSVGRISILLWIILRLGDTHQDSSSTRGWAVVMTLFVSDLLIFCVMSHNSRLVPADWQEARDGCGGDQVR